MDSPIIAETPAPRQPRWKECAGTERACLGVVATGLFCAVCAPANGAPAPKKIVLPRPAGETWAGDVARKGAQARLNGCRITARRVEHLEIVCGVTSQDPTGGGYEVGFNTVSGEYTCRCEAWEAGRMCAHVALLRTWTTPCPVCGAAVVCYVDHLNRGAVRCLGCDLCAELTADEAEALFEAYHGLTDAPVPILGLLLHVAARCQEPAGKAA
jgi:hypothetical protein